MTIACGAVIRYRLVTAHSDFFVVLGLATVISGTWTAVVRSMLMRKLLLAASSLFLVCTLLELGLWALERAGSDRQRTVVSNGGYAVKDPKYGGLARPGGPYEARMTTGDTVVYEGRYNIEPNRLRRVTEAANPTRTVLFFGGSFTFGDGVDDEKTMPSRVVQYSKGQVRAYNFAFSGWGAHQMLHLLRDGHVAENVEPVGRVTVVYYALADHVRRVAGLTDFDHVSQLFALDPAGGLRLAATRVGTPKEWVVQSAIYRRFFRAELPVETEHYDLYVAIVEESRKRLADLYPNCDFQFLVEPNEEFRDELAARGVEARMVPPVPPSERFADDHPNAAGHASTARFVWTEVLDQPG